MTDNLSNIIAYTNGVYRAEKLSYDTPSGKGVDDTPPNWGVVNEEYGTVEQVTYILFQAIEAADNLKEELVKATPEAGPTLSIV